MSTEHSDPWIGATIDGRYAVRDRVARGGMSTVYLAHDTRLERDVALKVLFPHMAEDRKVVDRFEQEARNAALISHDNVVRILDQGQTRETAYLVMEHVPGATLRTLLKRGPMTPRLALTYAEAVLQGLAAAHRAGLVHRDIKPENVLVSRDGRIKLADFGLARAATHHSGTSTLMGTVAYISPELLSGEGADERADIYAVGILLYEMLTGVQPYVGESPVRVAFQHVNSVVPPPSETVPGLAAALDELVRAATRPRAADRPADADALLELMHRLAADLDDDQLDSAPSPAPAVPAAGGAAGAGGAGTPQEAGSPDPDGAEETVAEGPADAAATATRRAPAGAAADLDATTVLGTGEDFPTTQDAAAWDDDVAAALQTARSGADDDAEEDRQTVAEVPTDAFRADPDALAAASTPAEAAESEAQPTEALAVSRPAAAPERHHDEPFAAAVSPDAARGPHRPGQGAPEPAQDTGEFSAQGASPRRGPRRRSGAGPLGPWGDRVAERLRRRDPHAVERRERQRPTVALARPTATRRWLMVALLLIGTALLILLAWHLGLSPGIVPSLGDEAGPPSSPAAVAGTTDASAASLVGRLAAEASGVVGA
ncbi:protein kinase domain-containing protein [Nesterenkonia halophila]|uniref:protein kinase domain-containing protein n=1 Tax=Nesterenkonia halophila TaxID=302044 RepID=UPI001FE892B1|nr:protein kinase [Nesterenkonia halophila]